MDFIATVASEDLAGLGRSVGTPNFYRALMTAVSAFVPGDFESITIYSKQACPRVAHFASAPSGRNSGEVSEILSLYNSAFFRFDPFFRYWREISRPGVVPLYEVAEPANRDELYMASYMPAMHLVDDVVAFLPIPGERAVALGRERTTRYRAAEIDRLRQLYPLLSGLNEAHLRAVGSDEMFEPLPGDDPPGPAPPPLNFGAAVDTFTSRGFTPREQEILRLLLVGCPNSFIARRLKIGAGTDRNHRKRLYEKLDVTSEREIFSLFIGHLANKDPGSLIS